MIEHLPLDSPWRRDRTGPWVDRDWILHDLSSRMRELLVLTQNIHRGKGAQPATPTYLPTPPPAVGGDAATPDAPVGAADAAQRTELSALIHRGG